MLHIPRWNEQLPGGCSTAVLALHLSCTPAKKAKNLICLGTSEVYAIRPLVRSLSTKTPRSFYNLQLPSLKGVGKLDWGPFPWHSLPFTLVVINIRPDAEDQCSRLWRSSSTDWAWHGDRPSYRLQNLQLGMTQLHLTSHWHKEGIIQALIRSPVDIYLSADSKE